MSGSGVLTVVGEMESRLVLLLFCALLGAGTLEGAPQGLPPPVIAVFDTSDGTDRPLDAIPDTDILLEGVRSARLECWAPYPVQWSYSGNGAPVMETETSSTSPAEFTATARIERVNEHQTGEYSCISAEDPNLRSYFYVYVPGPAMFAPEGGKTVEIDSNVIHIPCTAASPYVNLRLEKISGPQLQRQPIFDQRRGFFIEVNDKQEAQGAYQCTAESDGVERALEYHLKLLPTPEIVMAPPQNSSDPPCVPPCADNAKCVFRPTGSICQCLEPLVGDGYHYCGTGRPPVAPENLENRPRDRSMEEVRPRERNYEEVRPRDRARECESHSDCPAHLSCFSDSTCRDPCLQTIQGLECSKLGVCSVVNHRPSCLCPEGMYETTRDGCQWSPEAGRRSAEDSSHYGSTTNDDHYQPSTAHHSASQTGWPEQEQDTHPASHGGWPEQEQDTHLASHTGWPDQERDTHSASHAGWPEQDTHAAPHRSSEVTERTYEPPRASWESQDRSNVPPYYGWVFPDGSNYNTQDLRYRAPPESFAYAPETVQPVPEPKLMTSGERVENPGFGPCKRHAECPSELSCFTDNVCRDPCTDALTNLQCGWNAECKTVNHTPVCACRTGYYGDPLEQCYARA